MKGCVPVCVAVASLCCVGHAQPKIDFDYTTATGDSANLVLTTDSVGLPPGEYQITGITGSLTVGSNVEAVTGFAAGSGLFASADGLYALDNLVYLPPPSNNPFASRDLDSHGFLVYTTGGEFNVRSSAGLPFRQVLEEISTPMGGSSQNDETLKSFSFGKPPAATPEPFSLGFGAAGLVMALRRCFTRR
jgi:hypothetical protein